MIKKIVVIILTIFFGSALFSVQVGNNSSNRFPWKKKWSRHELYRMAIFYYEAGLAYEKKGKRDKARHCYLHANNTSPYSDIGAKSRKKLKDNYNETLHEPTEGELVAWLKQQPDLTSAEKAYIADYERRQQGGTPTQEGTPDSASNNEQVPPQTGPTTRPGGETPPSGTAEPATPGASQSGQTNPPQDSAQSQSQNSGNNITDQEIQNQGERVRYRDDATPSNN